MPLAIALLNVSNPDMTALDALSRLSHDADTDVAQCAVLALGGWMHVVMHVPTCAQLTCLCRHGQHLAMSIRSVPGERCSSPDIGCRHAQDERALYMS